ncbi:AfsR/SARP family transcriptional regulator [Micromonospora sp. I033]
MPIGAAYKPRLMLAALLSRADQPVTTEWLLSMVWHGPEPPSARRNLHQYVHRLRGAVGAERLPSRSGGYAILTGGDFDVAQFRSGAAAGGAALADGDPERASRVLRAALDLWHGEAYAEFGDCGELANEAARLEEERLAAYELWAGAEFTLGRSTAVINVLLDLVRAHPFRESMVAALMRALYGAGRQAEALRAFHDARVRFGEQLGVEPGPELRRLHEQILRHDARLATPGPVTSPPTALAVGRDSARPVPRELLADVSGFAGREASLKDLDELLPAPDPVAAAPVAVAVVTGMAGVGKTSLAVHWAHGAAHQFPDGQLYVNLRGFDPAGDATDPAEALGGFLDAFGVTPEMIPHGLEARSRLYRSLLADRRVLVLLDNARNAEQVRPLLPGAAGCFALVTSRHQLSALVTSHNARLVPLDPLEPAEARDLIAHRIGVARVLAEPDAANEIIARSGQLPLALAVVSARAAARPRAPLSVLAAELADVGDGLSGFTNGDPVTDVRAVFSWSYQGLSPGAARLFRLLGQHPRPDVSTPALASLAGTSQTQVRPLLGELVDSHLVVERSPDLHTAHNLLHAYALELAYAADGDHERHAATVRMLDHYVHSAYTGALLLYPHRHPVALPPAAAGVTRAAITDHESALAWFGAELPALLAATQHAAAAGHDTHTWRLAWSLFTYLDRCGLWEECAALLALGVSATVRLRDPLAQAHSLHCLAGAETWLGRHDEAHAHYERAIDLFDSVGDDVGRGHSHLNRALLFEREDRQEEALRDAERSLELFRAAGSRSGQAKSLNAVGWYQCVLGRPRDGMRSCQSALELMRELGDRYGAALAWDSIGYAHHLLEEHSAAVDAYQESVTRWRQLADRHSEAAVLQRLGDSHHAAGDHGRAETAWRTALRILTELGQTGPHPLRERLSGSGP